MTKQTTLLPRSTGAGNNYTLLREALQYIASRCDYAQELDGVGFSKSDASIGHYLSEHVEWTVQEAKMAYECARRYRNTQLPGAGIDFRLIRDPLPSQDKAMSLRELRRVRREKLEAEEAEQEKHEAEERLAKGIHLPNAGRCSYCGHMKTWEARVKNPKTGNMMPAHVDKDGRLIGDGDCPYWVKVREEKDEEARREREAAEEVERANKAERERLGKKLKNGLNLAPLYDYQRPHAKQLIKALLSHRVALDGSSTGTGKTYTNCVVTRELGLKALVICPKAVIPGWRRTFAALGMEYLGVTNYALARLGKMQVQAGTYTRGANKGQPKYKNEDCPYIIKEPNPSTGKYEPRDIYRFELPENGVIIFDEAHRTKNRDTINAQLMRAAKDANCRILLLTATLTESPLKMDATGYALGLHESKWDFYNWAEGHGCRKRTVNRYGQTAWVFNGSTRVMKMLHDEIYGAGKGSRMDVRDLIAAGKFPESQVIAETFNMNGNVGKINKAYAEMEKALADLIAAKKDTVENVLSVRQEARQKTELLKVPFLVDYTKDLVEEGKSVVVFVNYTQTLHELCTRLDTKCTIYGGNTGTTNEANRLAFEDNKEHVIVCNVAAAREGIDLHDKYQKRPRVALITPDDNAQNLKQCLGRVHRAGGTASTQYIVYAADTIEADVCDNVRHKIKNIDVLNDGDLSIPAQF